MGRQTAQDTVGMNVVLRIGSLFYVEVEGSARRQAEVSGFALSAADGATRLSLDIANTGTSDITTDAQFHIMDDKGMVYDRGQFNPTYTLPNETAAMSAEAKQRPAPGDYTLVITIDLGKAQKDAGLQAGPVIVKEAPVRVSADGAITAKGALR